MATNATEIAHQEISNPSATSTLLFIHGATSNGQEWDLVTPFLTLTYHILLPDLPGHAASSHLTPFSISYSTTLLADLIRRKAIGGKAHIIGLSLGAHAAVALASAYPELAETVLISGYSTFGNVSTETMARGLWVQSRIESFLPRSVIRWAMDGTDVPKQATGPSMELCRQIAAPHTPDGDQTIQPWTARTLIVVAGKKDLLPTADNADDPKRLKDSLLDTQGGLTKAVTHMALRHPWNRQRPELFAQTVRCWIEDGEVVEGFLEL